MSHERFRLAICGGLLVLALAVVSHELPEIWSFKPLSGHYRAYLMRYEPDPYSTRPHRNKHAIVRITFDDNTQVEFRSKQSGAVEWISSGAPLKILYRMPEGKYGKPEYEVGNFAHQYCDSLLFTGIGVICAFSLWHGFREKDGQKEQNSA
jgi:hypothetical protein